MNELPEGWSETTVKAICELQNGRAYKQEELLEAGKYPVLRVGNFFSNRRWYYSDFDLEDEKYCHDGDLLYAWSASFGPKIWDGGTVIYHYHIWRVDVEPKLVEKRFLFHWFEWDKENIKSDLGTGSTMIHVTKGGMEERRLLLPPLPEQRRIVAKVDGLTARTARARKDLNRIPTLIARYKQRLLALAISGELTAGWRTQSKITRSYNDALIEDVAEIITGFTPPTEGKDRYFGGTIPFFKPTDLDSGYYVEHPRETLTDEGANRGRRVPAGSTLVTCIGATIGKTGFARVDCCTNQQINALVPNEKKVQAEWLFWAVLSPDFNRAIINNSSATTLPIINKGRFKRLPLSIPPMEEQAEIVHRIESAFGWLDRMAADHAAAARLLPKLDAAILAKAFRGELVPQDPNDEPASVLLERVRAERDSKGKATKGARGRPRQSVVQPSLLDSLSPAALPILKTPLPARARNAAMTKSRQDDDVRGQPYLAGLLKSGRVRDTQSLFSAADLPVADFYKQLAWEIDHGHIIDTADEMKAA